MSRTSRISRTIATVLTAVIAVALIVATSATPATAKKGKAKGFKQPHSYSYVTSTCTKVSEGEWHVVYTWKAKGGRYINYGNMDFPTKKRDVVRRGGSRTIKYSEYITGMDMGNSTVDGSEIAAPETSDAELVHLIRSIKGSKYKNIEITKPDVKLDCK